MRHLKSGRALGVKPAHRRAMMRNMVTSLLEHGRIRTTVTRAKELRKPLDEMITLGKQGDLAARRLALRFVKSKASMAALFGDLAERYKERAGGYSRIMRLGPRRGDGAEMAVMVLVGDENDPFAEDKKGRRRRPARQPKPVLDEVADEVQDAGEVPKAKAAGSSKAGHRAKAPAGEGEAGAAAPAESAGPEKKD